MEEMNYTFFSTFYDKEQLRQVSIALNKEDVDYKIIDKSISAGFKAPLGAYIEVDLLVLADDYEKAAALFSDS